MTTDPHASDHRPGRPMPSGFNYRPVSEFPELAVTDEERARFDAFRASVDEAQRIAAKTAREVVVRGR